MDNSEKLLKINCIIFAQFKALEVVVFFLKKRGFLKRTEAKRFQ